ILSISVWDNKDVDETVFVRPDGKISLPLLGEVQAGGLTVQELTSKLTQEYGKAIKNPNVMVGVKEIRSRPVFFVGGFGKTGPMHLTQDWTLLQVIANAGGFTNLAAPNRVSVLRAEGSKKETLRVNVENIMRDPSSVPDVRLQPNDIIIVPQRLF